MPTPRYVVIRRDLAGRIAAGEWLPGTALPPRSVLLQEYGGSMSTLQRALQDLLADGIVESHGGHGTRVANGMRELLGLCFMQVQRDHFDLSLQQGVRHFSDSNFKAYAGLADHHGDWEALTKDIADHKLRGLIINGELHRLSQKRQAYLLDALPLSVIGFAAPTVSRITVDLYASLRWLLDAVIAAGRKRPAILLRSRKKPALAQRIHGWMRTRGLDPRPELVQEMDGTGPHAAAALVRLWLALPANSRPDTLLITDDHFVPVVTSYLRRAGIQCPDELLVFAHANEYVPSRCSVPAQRYGFQVQTVLQMAVDLLGVTPACHRVLKPVWFADS